MMKALLRVFAVVTLIASQFLLAGCTTTKSLNTTDLAEAKDLDRKFAEAMSTKDLDS